VTDTFTEAINQVNGLGYTPGLRHPTGDLTHLATADQFDQVQADDDQPEDTAHLHRPR